MADIIIFTPKAERLALTRAQLDQTIAAQEALIAESCDIAILEVHRQLDAEIRAGTMSSRYQLLVDALADEINRRGLNVVDMTGIPLGA